MEAYRLAQTSDPAFQTAQYAYEAAQEKLPQAVAGLLPTITATGNKNHSDTKANFSGMAQTNRGVNSWTWNVQLTQPLFRLENWMAYNESGALAVAADAEYAKAKQDLILKLAQAYFGVLVAEESARAAESRQLAMEEQGRAAGRNYELGTASVTDFQEARSKAEMARSEWVAAKNELESRKADLERLTGKSFDRLAALKPQAGPPGLEPGDQKSWVEQARENNPDVRMQQAAVNAAEFAERKTRFANFGTVDFVASYGGNYTSGNISIPTNYETHTKSATTGVQFSMPIFAGGLNSSKIREASANKSKAAAQLEDARRKASVDARQAYVGVAGGISQIEALKVALEAGESSLKGNEVGYKMGLRINRDVLDAEQQLYASRRDFAKARYETLLQGLKLKAAAGVLAENDIEAINALLE